MSENSLWRNNKQCPECGEEVNPNIKACETGYNYCSQYCAGIHVKKTYRPWQLLPNIYLAHSVYERERGKTLQKELEDRGYRVWNPFYSIEREDIQKLDSGIIEPWQIISKSDALTIIKNDLVAVRKQDCIVAILPERRTFGIPCEVMFASLVGIPIYSITKSLGGHPWVLGLSERIWLSESDFLSQLMDFR